MFYFIHIHVYLFFSHQHIIIIITYFYLRSWSQVSLKRSLQNKKKKFEKLFDCHWIVMIICVRLHSSQFEKKSGTVILKRTDLPFAMVSGFLAEDLFFSLMCLLKQHFKKKKKNKKICSFNGLPFCLLPPFLGRRSSSLLISFCYFHFGIEIW